MKERTDDGSGISKSQHREGNGSRRNNSNSNSGGTNSSSNKSTTGGNSNKTSPKDYYLAEPLSQKQYESLKAKGYQGSQDFTTAEATEWQEIEGCIKEGSSLGECRKRGDAKENAWAIEDLIDEHKDNITPMVISACGSYSTGAKGCTEQSFGMVGDLVGETFAIGGADRVIESVADEYMVHVGSRFF
ncbi:hypothetical protein ACIA8H_10690 [Streptomyces goshikiensis]|uniref:hypothetical protein n=1 Tax=Streptomyces goshikiensis TaxID=1942 RepID=UPI00378CFA13